MKDCEMVRACGMCRNDARFLWGGQEEWNHLEDNRVNNRTVLKYSNPSIAVKFSKPENKPDKDAKDE